jgi:hypothetical protein
MQPDHKQDGTGIQGSRGGFLKEEAYHVVIYKRKIHALPKE